MGRERRLGGCAMVELAIGDDVVRTCFDGYDGDH